MRGLRVIDRFDREVEVTLGAADLSADDLARALEPTTHFATMPLPRGVIVDGRWHPPATPIDDLALRQGSLVHPSPTPPVVPAEPTARALLSADDGARAEVSSRAVHEGLGLSGGVVPFNRPPRLAPAVEPSALEVPAEPPEPPPRESLSIAGIILPILGGAVIAVLLSPMLAVFAALGPFITIGMWWERRYRAELDHRRARAVEQQACEVLQTRLPLLGAAEVARQRAVVPAMDAVVSRALRLSSRIWERGATDPDAFCIGVATTHDIHRPPLHVAGASVGDEPSRIAVDMVESAPPLVDVPLVVELSPGRVVGIVGPRARVQSLARALAIQLVVHHGPSVVRLVVAASVGEAADWQWCRWLPHCADPVDAEVGALIGTTADVELVGRALAGAEPPAVVGVLDDPAAFHGRHTVGRRLLDHENVALIVIAPSVDRLPAGCTDILGIDDEGTITHRDPRRAGVSPGGAVWQLSIARSVAAARRLAQLDDPALERRDSGLPAAAPLLQLLGLSGDEPAEVRRRWEDGAGSDALVGVIGADAFGPVELDLVADGPHVLIGGTTGSGKSELLRSLIAGLAAAHDPDHCAFVLIDYKGGAAFDRCRDLPHVAGFVTDLDQALAARALHCLEAELRHREGRLRDLGAQDIAAFRAADAPGEPLPRLLVVVDEFATLAAELPDFLDALIGIAQRGRSLGVHLILATQRPAGAVTDDIRANAGCRIALRMTDSHDSVDVIGVSDAATISRTRPGRAIARLGPSELISFQSALATGHQAEQAPIEIRVLGESAESSVVDDDGSSDLERLVATIGRAWGTRPAPRAPWPEPLPGDVDRESGAWWLVDDPGGQCRRTEGWHPADGHLVVIGGPARGATTTLSEAAFTAIHDGAHVHIMDLDSGRLGALDALPAVGSVVGPTETERRRRLLRRLDREVADRRAQSTADTTELVLVIDDLGGLERAHDPIRERDLHEQLARIWADGPSVGVVVAVSLRRAAELPTAMAATAGTIIVHHSADPADGLRFGLPALTVELPPGRARRCGDGALLHVMRSGPDLEQAAKRRLDVQPSRAPFEIGVLPMSITASEVDAAVTLGPSADLTIAIADDDLEPVTLSLHHGEHALVLGPARSGRTTALATIGRLASQVIVVGSESPLAEILGVDPVAPAELPDALAVSGPTLLLADDCLAIDDPTGDLAGLVAAPPAGVHVIASARPTRLRQAYGHWAIELAASRAGILLQPESLDGDLLGARLPNRLASIDVPGRGFLVADGRACLVQLVRQV